MINMTLYFSIIITIISDFVSSIYCVLYTIFFKTPPPPVKVCPQSTQIDREILGGTHTISMTK